LKKNLSILSAVFEERISLHQQFARLMTSLLIPPAGLVVS